MLEHLGPGSDNERMGMKH